MTYVRTNKEARSQRRGWPVYDYNAINDVAEKYFWSLADFDITDDDCPMENYRDNKLGNLNSKNIRQNYTQRQRARDNMVKILEMRRKGIKLAAISQHVGVSAKTICEIIRGKNYD